MFVFTGHVVGWLRDELPKYWKAAAATAPVVLFVGAEVVQALQEGTVDGSLTAGDFYRILTAAVAAYAVYKAKNKPAEA